MSETETETETAYLLSRAEQEAIAAIQADHPSASAAHQELSMRYSVLAISELDDSEPGMRKSDEHRRDGHDRSY